MDFKKRLLLFVFLLVLPVVFGDDWVFNSEYIVVELDISGKIDLVPRGSRYSVDYVITNLSFVPQDGFQEEVLELKTEPRADVKEGVAIYRWDEPNENELMFSLKSDIKSFNKVVRVRDKVSFPLTDLPDDVIAYTKPSETIDSDNKEIIKKASEIIGGEDDLYVVVFKLGKWTKENIEYDLSTLTEGVSQKASWVLTNKEGVCDELTNLFIAMNRALGIPAKFISGIAYTNSELFEEGFGAHGWAEVYFPGYGWVPFDVTYGEFGFVDASHIKLKESLDANDASTRFQWLGKDIDVKTSPLDIKADVKKKKGDVSESVSINARSVKNNIGFGSYNLIEATVENLRDYYVATKLVLSKSPEIEVIGEDEKNVLLEPDGEKKVFWIVKVSYNLEQGYMYTFPFIVRSVRNVSADVRFDVIEEGKRFSLEGIESLVKDSEEDRSYSGNVELGCRADKEWIYEYESAIVKCDVKNIGNVYLEELNVCLEEDCKKVSLGITQEGNVSFQFKPKEAGAQEIVIKANNEEVSKSVFFDITVYDKPIIEISDIVYPEEVRYKELYAISFILKKKSKFPPYNVSIKIEPVGKEFELNQLDVSRRFNLTMYGSELKVGENRFRVSINYKDKKGNIYETSKEFRIGLVDVNIFQRIAVFFKGIGKSVVSVFK